MTDLREPFGDDDADVARLLRLAGKRPAVPAERLARVRSATKAHWERAVARQRRARTLWGVAALAAAACVTAWLLVGRTSQPEIVIEVLSGSAQGGTHGIEVGGLVAVGSELTTAEDGRMALRLPSGHSVRLDTSTRIRVLGAGTLALARGAIYVDSGLRAATGAPLAIETPLGSIREHGTQFEVRLTDGSIAVRTREGEVRLAHASAMLEVHAGHELVVGADGTVARRPIPTHGADWDWTTGVAPMLALEGRSLREFLEWIARERGLRLVFADDRAERSASEIVLSGVAGRMTLDEALDAVLATSRMTSELEGGVLTVSLSPAARAARPNSGPQQGTTSALRPA